MVDEQLFEQGRRELEAILNREISATKPQQDKAINSWYDGVKSGTTGIIGVDSEKLTLELMRELLMCNGDLLYLRTGVPEIVGRGTHQAVIELRNGLVAKVPHKYTDWQNDDVFRINGGYLYTKKTRDELVELGFRVPEFKFYGIIHTLEGVVVSLDVVHESWGDLYRIDQEDWNPRNLEQHKIPMACITQDLRENGRYKVVEYDKENARRLVNSEELVSQFNAGYELLMGHVPAEGDSGIEIDSLPLDKPELQYEPHKLKTPDEAIRKMFLLQVPTDEREEGKLVVGDIDHVYLYR